ncbi:MAG: hypothetical protein INF91_12485 [Alphaproteobacteria bacterium]|nr:hypothetical protein [Alphaproteobacteria bacterium]
MFAPFSKTNLQRVVAGGLGAALFASVVLVAATGPAVAIAPVQVASITSPAGAPSA